MKGHLVERGIGPLPPHVRFGDSIEKNHNPYSEPHEERFAHLWNLSRKAETIYFVGCTACYRQKSIAQSTVQILNSLDMNFGVLGSEEWCCGSPLIRTGQMKLARKVAEHNAKVINESKADEVITSCAGCFLTMKEDYKKFFGIELNPEVLHTSELLYLLWKEGDLHFPKGLNMNVTYHDPCHLGRGMGVLLPELERERVYEPPRGILKAIPELKLLEMPRNRDYSWCCGAGGGVKAAFPELALWSAKERVKEASGVNAQAIVTTCPFCVRNLRDAVEEFNMTLGVYDLTEIVSKALAAK